MAETGCAGCKWRGRYDENPRSFLGRLWRWHTNWCPGWKKYLAELPEDERDAVLRKYGRR